MRNLVVQLALFLLFPFISRAQQPKGFDITGYFSGFKDGEMVRLGNRFADWHKATWMDSCKVVHGQFHLKSTAAVEDGPREYEIWLDDLPRRDARFCALLIDNGDKIVIKGGDINKIASSQIFRNVLVEGSPSCYAWNSLLPMFLEFERCYSIILRKLGKIQDSVGFDRELVKQQLDNESIIDNGLEAAFSNIAMDGPAVPFIMYDINQVVFGSHYHAAFVPNLYNRLDEHTQKSYYGQLLGKFSRLCVGQVMPNFDLPTPEGKLLSLRDFTALHKMTIVHFWGSNSIDRQKYQHELRVMYRKYHDRGLDIIGVSADSVADNWKEAVEEGGYPWINVSDLKGNLDGGIVNDVYNEGGHAIPNTTNVLLDADGKIIAWDASGVELQWYLWKYFGE